MSDYPTAYASKMGGNFRKGGEHADSTAVPTAVPPMTGSTNPTGGRRRRSRGGASKESHRGGKRSRSSRSRRRRSRSSR